MGDAEGFIGNHKKIFDHYHKLIKWLVRWRIVFLKDLGIDIDRESVHLEAGDHVLAYIIDRVHAEHPFRWQFLLREIEETALKLYGEPKGNPRYIGYLNLVSTRHYGRDAIRRIKKFDNSEDGGRVDREELERQLKGFPEQIRLSMMQMDTKSEFKNRGWLSTQKLLPRWYQSAIPRHQFFKEEFKGKKLHELEIEEERLDMYEIKLIHGLQQSLQETDIDKQFFNQFQLRKYFERMNELLQLEISVRTKILDSEDFDEVVGLNEEIKGCVLRQKENWKKMLDPFKNTIAHFPKTLQHQKIQLYHKVLRIIQNNLECHRNRLK